MIKTLSCQGISEIFHSTEQEQSFELQEVTVNGNKENRHELHIPENLRPSAELIIEASERAKDGELVYDEEDDVYYRRRKNA